jgi:hypothetical protein
MRQLAVSTACLAFIAFAGCSGEKVDRPDPVAVTGVVTHNGNPVEGADVIFQPAGHTYAASGKTDASGTFTLTAFQPNDGAVPGEYKVTVSKRKVTPQGAAASDDAPTTVKQEVLLPIKYADPNSRNSSGLTASVKAGAENKFEFKLAGDLSKASTTPRPTVRTGE